MSKAEPVFGIDIAYPYQKGIDLGLVNEHGYKFVVAKATEGPYRDGTSYTNPLFSQWRERAEQLGLIFGAYAFLVETPAQPQVDLFLKTAGDVSGMILMLDFEASNPPYQYLTPGNETLRGFIAELRSRVGKHPIVLYSNRSFWNGGTPSGDFDQYDADVAWDAYYWSNTPVQDRKSTRLNSSHANISYAVFCLKKKKTAKTKSLICHSYRCYYTRST